MHRALFTWFILLVFFILLCLRLESRTHWNWFLIFLPMWFYDFILLIDAFFNIVLHCKREHIRTTVKNKNNLLILVILLKIAAQIILCLKLEYPKLELDLHHVLIPLWILLPILIINVSYHLYKVVQSYWLHYFYNTFKFQNEKCPFYLTDNLFMLWCCCRSLTFLIMALLKGWRYAAFIGSLVGAIGITLYPIIIYPMTHIEEYSK